MNWQSEIYADVDNPVTDAAEQIRQKSFALVDLMARYEIDRNWSVQANIYNVFDKNTTTPWASTTATRGGRRGGIC